MYVGVMEEVEVDFSDWGEFFDGVWWVACGEVGGELVCWKGRS